jgi:hypothetical protein
MQNSLKSAIGTLTVICLAAAMLVGCTQAGTPGVPGQDGINNAQTQGFGTGMNNAGGNGYGNTMIGGNTGYNDGAKTDMNNGLFGRRDRTNAGTNLSTQPNVNNGVTGTQMSAADRQRAENIRKQIMNMQGVNSADVIVMGDTALCGVNTDRNASLSQLRNSISQRVRQIDGTIKNVAVSNDSDILTEIRKLVGTSPNATGGNTVGNNRMNNGLNNRINNRTNNMTNNTTNNTMNNPVTNLMDQFNDLVRRATR